MDVFGTGTEVQVNEAKKLAQELGLDDQVNWRGNQAHVQVQEAMQQADLFFFTSVSEDTSTVVLEAIGNGLPILCFEACGFGAVVDERIGKKIALSTPTQSIRDFAEQLNYFEANRKLLKEMSINCLHRQYELSWEVKAQTMVELYREAIERFEAHT